MKAMDTAPQMTALPDAPRWTGYLSCDTCPLSIFIDCLLNQEYNKLIITGDATPDEVADAWLHLYSEYCKRSGNTAVDSMLVQVWERDCLATKIEAVKGLLRAIADHYDATIAECLALWGYAIHGSDDEDAFEGQIRVAQARLKGEAFKLKKLDEMLASMKAGAEELTRQSFSKQLIAVSKHNGYRLRIDELTVGEYCDYLNDYRTYAEAMNQQNASENG